MNQIKLSRQQKSLKITITRDLIEKKRKSSHTKKKIHTNNNIQNQSKIFTRKKN